MKHLLIACTAPLLALAPLPAAAQDTAPAANGPAPASASTGTPVDPARLAAARSIVDHIFPAGTYARLMGTSVNGILDKLLDTSAQIPLGEIVALSGRPAPEVAKLDKTTIADIMAIYDPVYQQRMSIMMHAFMTGMTDIMTQLEPDIRDGIAQAYAARFTLAQLSDMNRFFDTPSGQAYAANAMTIQTDPAVMSRMQAIYPRLFQQLPAIMEKAKQTTVNLPAQRKFSDLTPAERTKLANLLGIPEARLEANAAKK